jgi:hypothetical protein
MTRMYEPQQFLDKRASAAGTTFSVNCLLLGACSTGSSVRCSRRAGGVNACRPVAMLCDRHSTACMQLCICKTMDVHSSRPAEVVMH